MGRDDDGYVTRFPLKQSRSSGSRWLRPRPSGSLARSRPGRDLNSDWRDQRLRKQQGLSRDQFFAIMSAFPTGATVVTTRDANGRPKGLTTNAVCSVSAEPPLLLICIDSQSRTLPALLESRRWIVNFLTAGRKQLALHFASKHHNKFRNIPWRPGVNGMPLLYADSFAHAECSEVQRITAGDHTILVGLVEAGWPPSDSDSALMYFRRRYLSVSASRAPEVTPAEPIHSKSIKVKPCSPATHSRAVS